MIDPLAKLSQVAAQLGQGKVPDPLPEDAGTAEIQAVNMSFNRMVQDLRRMEADRELLLAGVSHDLRTPITRLRLEVELADLPEDSRTAMVSDLEQMENIVNQFLSYARHSHEEQELVNLGEAVQNAMSNARLASDSTVKITSHIAPNVFIVAHPLELSRAVQNLFTNAMRYGRSEDGILRLHITTGLTDNGKNAMLTVGDEGAGLPEDQRERVMRPFERGESARSGVTGTGLGLAIVDRIVRRSSGSVQLDSMDPHGLLVRVGFPPPIPPPSKPRRRSGPANRRSLRRRCSRNSRRTSPQPPPITSTKTRRRDAGTS
ncbi:MAG: ATP-binding protein [Sutterella wadsworthensis]